MFKDRVSGNLVTHEEMFKLYDKKISPLISQSETQDSNKKVNFLVYIVNKELTINDEVHTFTFLKDITFGILYEQIKAQEELRNMVNNTI